MQARTPSASSPSLTPLLPPQTATGGSKYTRAVKLIKQTATNAGEIADIPDLDGDGPHDDEERIAKGLGGVSLGRGEGDGVGTTETPDLDDILDMEEDDLEEGDDEATAAAPKA